MRHSYATREYNLRQPNTWSEKLQKACRCPLWRTYLLVVRSSATPVREPSVGTSGVGHAADGSEAVSAALRSVSSESCCDGGGSGDSCMHGAPCLTSCGRWSDEGAAASCSPAAPAAARRRHVRVECMVLQQEAVVAQVRGVWRGLSCDGVVRHAERLVGYDNSGKPNRGK